MGLRIDAAMALRLSPCGRVCNYMNTLLDKAKDKLLDWLLPLIGGALLGLLVLFTDYAITVLEKFPPKAVLMLLSGQMIVIFLLGTWLIRLRPRFVEHKGAFFKKKRGGGYHEAVYCGVCKKPASTGSYHVASHYKCSCGWQSEITKGELEYELTKLP